MGEEVIPLDISSNIVPDARRRNALLEMAVCCVCPSIHPPIPAFFFFFSYCLLQRQNFKSFSEGFKGLLSSPSK
jgi:hypothetical protein